MSDLATPQQQTYGHGTPVKVDTSMGQRIRLLSYNVQAGISTGRYRHYITHSWKHVLPHAQIYGNLDQIAHIASAYDVVALQEVDAGSLRSSFINQTVFKFCGNTAVDP